MARQAYEIGRRIPNRCGRIAKMLTLDADTVPLLAMLAGSSKLQGSLVSELVRSEVDRRRERVQWLRDQALPQDEQ